MALFIVPYESRAQSAAERVNPLTSYAPMEPKKEAIMFRFLSMWFRLCRVLGSPLGSWLAAPFFRVSVPPCWVWVGRRLGGRWVRRWAPRSCGRGSWSSGFRGSWACVSPSALPSLRRSVFVWWLCPAVVSRWGGVVFRVWVFWSPAPERR